MNNTPLLSIIVPVYNVEIYLRECLDSILNQSIDDYEMILIDDGSVDKSPSICKEYEKLDNRIKYIRKQNAGAASARNDGIKVASGKYIMFIDGDDYIEKNSINKILEKVNESGERDVIFLKSLCVLPNNETYSMYTYEASNYYNKSHEEVLSYLSSHDPLPVCVWGKLIKRELLLEHNILFTEGIIIEDVDFCMQLYMYAKTYNYIDTIHYYYRVNRKGSVMDANTDRKFYDLIWIIEKWAKLAKEKYINYAHYINMILAFQYCMLLPMYQKLPKEQRREQRSRTKDLIYLFTHSSDKRVKLLNVFYKLFGFGFVSNLLYFYNRLK